MTDLTDAQGWQLLRIRKADFAKLRGGLRLPRLIDLPNRSRFHTDEAFVACTPPMWLATALRAARIKGYMPYVTRPCGSLLRSRAALHKGYMHI